MSMPDIIEVDDQGTINVGNLRGIGEAVHTEATQGNTDDIGLVGQAIVQDSINIGDVFG